MNSNEARRKRQQASIGFVPAPPGDSAQARADEDWKHFRRYQRSLKYPHCVVCGQREDGFPLFEDEVENPGWWCLVCMCANGIPYRQQ